MPKLILASASPFRVKILNQLGYAPDLIIPADLDETAQKGELPRNLAARLALSKALKIQADWPEALVLAADTVPCLGRTVLPKTLNEDEAVYCLNKISGRRHRVYTGVCGLLGKRRICKIGISLVKFKCLSNIEKTRFLRSREWYGKAGGYGLQGIAASFIPWLSGSDTNVVGLPAYETYIILTSLGLSPNISEKP